MAKKGKYDLNREEVIREVLGDQIPRQMFSARLYDRWIKAVQKGEDLKEAMEYILFLELFVIDKVKPKYAIQVARVTSEALVEALKDQTKDGEYFGSFIAAYATAKEAAQSHKEEFDKLDKLEKKGK